MPLNSVINTANNVTCPSFASKKRLKQFHIDLPFTFQIRSDDRRCPVGGVFRFNGG